MIHFYRLNDPEPVGSLDLDGEAAVASGAAVDLLDAARRRGESDIDVYQRHTDWSNGAFISREDFPSRLDPANGPVFTPVPKRTIAGMAELVVGQDTMTALRAAEAEARENRRRRRR